MVTIYLLTTTVWNGTVQLKTDLAAFLSKDSADKAKEAVDKANGNSDYRVTTQVQAVDLFTHDDEVPILNPGEYDPKYGFGDKDPVEAMHNDLVAMAIATIKQNGTTTVDTIELMADNLQESTKAGKWVPATDSHLALFASDGKEVFNL